MKSRVSIIICIYNGEKYIPEITEYLISQTYRDIETVFVVSDRCTDDSLKIAEKCASLLNNCKVVLHENDKGLGDSKNCGIDNSTGDLLWFLDVDDIPSIHFLEYLIRMKSNNNADLVACNFVYSHNRNSLTEYEYDERCVRVMEGKEAMHSRSMEKFPVGSWSMLYEREVIEKNHIRFPDGLAEDISFTYDYLVCSKKVCYYGIPMYKYYQRSESITNSPSGMDRRGKSEILTYNGLESKYSHELDDRLKRRMVLVRLRSAGHMSYTGFLRYTKSDEVRQMVRRNKSPQVCVEYAIISALPTMYYTAIRLFFKAYFYNNGRRFT